MPEAREKSASRRDGARPEAGPGETQAWVAAGLLAFLAIGGMLLWRLLAAGGL